MYTLQMKLNNVLTRKTLYQFMAVAVLSLSIISCKKGDTGPAGATGTANVIYSDWFTASPWIKDTVFDVYGFNYTKAATDITQSILDSGTVITFGKLAGYNTLIWPTGTVSQMPIVINYKFSSGGITYTDTWSAQATLNKLKIRFVDDQNYYGSIATSHQFRYIIIPGGKKATAATTVASGLVTRGARTFDGATYDASIREVAKGYQQMSYAEICDKLGIPR